MSKGRKTRAETYRMPVICYDCDFKGEMDIPKGIGVGETLCPKCGNKTLRKALPGEAD